jgi:hypothetical protein
MGTLVDFIGCKLLYKKKTCTLFFRPFRSETSLLLLGQIKNENDVISKKDAGYVW